MKTNGYELYRGPSLIDGSPIVVIATGFATASDNDKTGDMIQTWILRADVEPHVALKSGDDGAVCGECPLRGELGKARTCYVTVHQGPLAVFRAWKRGRYPVSTGRGLAHGRMVRLGSYGDPAAAPIGTWEDLTHGAAGWTGYTHQWAMAIAAGLKRFCMASVETFQQRATAVAAGWRPFRVGANADDLLSSEVLCPASKEAGAKTTCAKCKLCMGTTSKARKSVMIPAHGIGAKAYSKRVISLQEALEA